MYMGSIRLPFSNTAANYRARYFAARGGFPNVGPTVSTPHSNVSQTPPPAGMKFADRNKPSLTNAEIRAVTEWRFGKKTKYSPTGERMKLDPATGQYVRWGI